MRKIQAKHSQESKKKRGLVWVCLLLLLITSLCFFGCPQEDKKGRVGNCGVREGEGNGYKKRWRVSY